MNNLDEKGMTRLECVNDYLDKKYGKDGTESRRAFDEKARAYYYGVILRDRRKELKMTQQQLADRVGTARSYIARVESGETDILLSSLCRIANALKMSFVPQMA